MCVTFHGSQCHGGWPGVYLGLPLLFVYLYLFQDLYRGKYKDAGVVGHNPQLRDSVAHKLITTKAQ